MDPYDVALEERIIAPLLARRARDDGERPFIVTGGRSRTFAEVDQASRAVARGLAARGVGAGSHVLMMLPNCAEFVFTWFGCTLLGAVAVPISVQLKGVLLENIIEDCGAAGMVVDRSLLPALATVRPEIRDRLDWVAVIGGGTGEEGRTRYIDFRDLAIATGPDPEVPCDFRQVQMISYTSGSTGPSKGVMVTNAQAFSSTCTFMKITGMTREDVLFTPLPLFHGLASRMGVMPALVLGAPVVIGERFSASRYFEQAAACGATVAQVVHAIVSLIKAAPPGPYDRAHKVRTIFNAAHDRDFEARFGVQLVEGFSMTETSFMLYTSYPDRRYGSTGRAHEDWELQLVDERDLPVPVGQAGELVGRPRRPHIMMQGYLNKPAATLEASRNLWFHTGDILRCDEDGYYYYIDRKKERIRRRGENVSSAEVEQVVNSHPDIVESAAIAHPAASGEDDIRLVLSLQEGAVLAPPALFAWLETRMPRFMLPRYIEILPVLPRGLTNKVDKKRLVETGLGPAAWDAGERPGQAASAGE